MKIQPRHLAVLLLTLLLCPAVAAQRGQTPHPKPEYVGLSSVRLQRVTDTFRAYVDKHELPGAVVLIARRGKVAYLEAFGQRDIDANAPMQPDTIFRIASQTKAIVSVGVMMLQEDGRLLISDPVAKYLPEFAKTTVAVPAGSAASTNSGAYDVVPAKRPITLRDLLTHTAGIGYGQGIASDKWKAAGIQGWYFADRNEPVGETVARMASLPFDAQPGERWVYGYNTDILGAVIERVSGEPLDVYLQRRILTPLGMRDTCFYLPRNKKDRLAVVYSARNDSIERAPDPGAMVGQGAYVDGPRRSFSGGAGLLSTAPDYARFLQMLLNGGELDGVRILSRPSVHLMIVDHLNGIEYEPGEGFGLGFSVVKDLGARGIPGSVGEYGWGGALHSKYWVDPVEQLIVVYMTQLIPAGDIDDHGKLRALVYQAIADQPAHLPRTVPNRE
jgi:CubicO group peptidase (beta-lactamase class C family)